MRAGQLDRRIRLQLATESRSASGAVVKTWANWGPELSARQAPGRGDERWIGEGEHAQAMVAFRIRYRPGVTRLMRLVYDGSTYDIRDIQEVGRREGLDLVCVAAKDS